MVAKYALVRENNFYMINKHPHDMGGNISYVRTWDDIGSGLSISTHDGSNGEVERGAFVNTLQSRSEMREKRVRYVKDGLYK